MYAYELDRNVVQVSGSCGPQSARAQFIVDAQTVTRIQDSGVGCITKTAGEIIETRPEDWCDQKQTLEGQTDTNRPS